VPPQKNPPRHDIENPRFHNRAQGVAVCHSGGIMKPQSPISPQVPGGSGGRIPLRKRFRARFLIVSLAVHVLFGLGAAYYVVEIITVKDRTMFKSGTPPLNAGRQTVEHRVQMAKKQNTMSAPMPARMVVSTGLSKIALPEIPAVPGFNPATPTTMAGAGLVGTGMTFAPKVTTETGDGGGNGMLLFGVHERPSSGALRGTLFDFKQSKYRLSTKMDPVKCGEIVVEYARGGFHEGMLDAYFKSSQALYTTQFFIPEIPSSEGPRAFGLGGIVKPDMWIAHYTGKVSPPATGTYYLVGEADDFLYVKFEGRIIMDSCWKDIPSILKPTAVYDYGSSAYPLPFKRSEAIHVETGKYYDMEVVIGDLGGMTNACLLFEQEGVDYTKDGKGNPILPPFRLARARPPATPRGMTPLTVMEDGPVWSAAMEQTPAFDIFQAKADPASGR
jgi:PA14 domain